MTVILTCCGQLLLHFEACYFQTTFLPRVFVILDFSESVFPIWNFNWFCYVGTESINVKIDINVKLTLLSCQLN